MRVQRSSNSPRTPQEIVDAANPEQVATLAVFERTVLPSRKKPCENSMRSTEAKRSLRADDWLRFCCVGFHCRANPSSPVERKESQTYGWSGGLVRCLGTRSTQYGLDLEEFSNQSLGSVPAPRSMLAQRVQIICVMV